MQTAWRRCLLFLCSERFSSFVFSSFRKYSSSSWTISFAQLSTRHNQSLELLIEMRFHQQFDESAYNLISRSIFLLSKALWCHQNQYTVILYVVRSVFATSWFKDDNFLRSESSLRCWKLISSFRTALTLKFADLIWLLAALCDVWFLNISQLRAVQKFWIEYLASFNAIEWFYLAAFSAIIELITVWCMIF